MERKSLIQRHPRLTNLQKRIFLFLIDHEDEDGLIRVRQQDIAQSLGIQQSSVNRALRRIPMFSRELVIWIQKDENPSRYRGNVYWFRNELAANPQNRDRSTLHTGNGS